MVEQSHPSSMQLKWASVPLQEIIANDYRLDASFYGVEGRQALNALRNCKWGTVDLKNCIKSAFYLGRFKRVYVEKRNGIPFILPSQITEVYPKATKFISHTSQIIIESTRVKRGQVLLTRSGTIGIASYVSTTLANRCLSDDVIRIETTEYSGYFYAYLKSSMGRMLLETNQYGAVISHIEPEHLHNIPIPNPPDVLKQKIHTLIEESFKLRDDSNVLMDETQSMLKHALKLPNIEALKSKANKFDNSVDFLNFSIPLGALDDRLDGSYHIPIVRVIEQYLSRHAKEVTCIGDRRISSDVILPSRFKRVYVEKGNGIIFFGGRQIHQLDPSNKKYLSFTKHGRQTDNQLKIYGNITLITRSGTIGKVAIVPEHWNNWIPNEHIIRVVPTSNEIAGYMYAWLASDYAYQLITRFIYGAVVDEIDDKQVSRISIPLLQSSDTQKEINDKVLKANKKRADAYYLEQKALKILNTQVIFSK